MMFIESVFVLLLENQVPKMANNFVEATDVLQESKLSRFEIAKMTVNPYKLGLETECRLQGNSLCIRKHNHCELDLSGNRANIESWADLPKDDIPGKEVLKRLMAVLKNGNDFSAVTWGTNETFTRRDITLMYDVVCYIERLKISIKMEREMRSHSETPPAGLSDLARLESCQKICDVLWHSPVQSNRVDIVPSDHPSSEVRIQEDEANIYNAERYLSIRQLDSESLPELGRLDGEMTTQIADHFVNLIQADDPTNTFIHVDYTKDTFEKRTAHARELGLGSDSIGWTFLLFNKGGSNANTVLAYHWVLGAFSPDGVCFYGDSLPGSLPKNIRALLEPYYVARFPDTPMPDIYNCSEESYFPHYPSQRGDGYICGFVCLLVMMTAKQETILKYIFTKNTIGQKMTFLKNPSRYPAYLRNVIQTVYVEKTATISHILSKSDVNVIVKNAAAIKLPDVKQRRENVRTNTTEQEEGSLPATNASNDLRDLSKIQTKPKSKSKRQSLTEAIFDIGNESPIIIEEAISDDEENIAVEAEKDFNYKLGNNNTGKAENTVDKTLEDEAILHKTNIVCRTKDFPNDDSFVWKVFGKKNKKNAYQMYACIDKTCAGRKKVRLPFYHMVKGRKYQPLGSKMKVVYLQAHTCNRVTVSEKITKEDSRVEERDDSMETSFGGTENLDINVIIGDKSDNKVLNEAEIQEDTRKHVKDIIKCTECDLELKSACQLDYHKQLYHSSFKTEHLGRLKNLDEDLRNVSYKYWCYQCGYEAQTSVLLEKHTTDSHGMFQEFNCDECTYETDTKLDLINHMKFKHFIYDPARVKCAHCGFGPTKKYNLGIHMQQNHETEKVCYLCDKTFQIAQNMEDETNELERIQSEFMQHLREEHGLTNYFCHICGFKTDSHTLFTKHEHTQQMLIQDCEFIYSQYVEEVGSHINHNDGELPDLNDSFQSMRNLEEEAELDQPNFTLNDDNYQCQEINNKNNTEALFVDYKVGTKYEKFKLIQLETYPSSESRDILINGNIAVIICSESLPNNGRGHFDCFNWGPASGTRKMTKINTYKCKENKTGCLAVKRKWKCVGKCEFEGNFCCTYSMEEKDALVVVYMNEHNHGIDGKESIPIESLENERQEETCVNSSDVVQDDVANHVLSENAKEVNSFAEEECRTSNRIFDDEFKDELSLIKDSIKKYYPFSQVKETARQGIKEDEMLDYFHILKKEGPKVSEVAKDGYLYKRSHSNKNVPKLMSGEKQHINVYTCEGILICPNEECEIFRRVTHLNQVNNAGQKDKFCKHCPTNSKTEMILEECHAKVSCHKHNFF